MMRFTAVLVGVLFAATAAFGRPHAISKLAPIPGNHLLLDLGHLHLFHRPEASDSAAAASPDGGQDWSRHAPLPDFSMGTLHAEFGQDDDPISGLSEYKLQDQLGSSAWKEQENRSHAAKLMFVWPTDK